MDDKATGTVSRRWEDPTYNAEGKFWTAELRSPLSVCEQRAGLERAVYGPTADACVRETVRQDRVWAEYPLRKEDRDGARGRLRFLAGGAA
jgi:hypothetical protein